MSLEARNRTVIEAAFAKFRATEFAIIRQGMINIAQAGLLYLVDAHEIFNLQDSHNHLNEDNTLAWAVAYNGQTVDCGDLQGSTDDESYPGDASAEARALLKETTGWVAVIYSSMEGWYRFDWEEMYLRYTRDMIYADFDRIFKRV